MLVAATESACSKVRSTWTMRPASSIQTVTAIRAWGWSFTIASSASVRPSPSMFPAAGSQPWIRVAGWPSTGSDPLVTGSRISARPRRTSPLSEVGVGRCGSTASH